MTRRHSRHSSYLSFFSNSIQTHPPQGSYDEIGTVGEGAFSFFLSHEEHKQGTDAAGEYAKERNHEQWPRAEPETETGYEFDIATPQGAPGEDGDEEEYRTSGHSGDYAVHVHAGYRRAGQSSHGEA